jgi:orotidine-5'-phosphate decarboxylase
VAKVGLELYTAAGPDAIGSLLDLGYKVFLDLKVYDIPTTVEKAARVVGASGSPTSRSTPPAAPTCCGRASTAWPPAPSAAGLEPPIPLAVTVLTSDSGRAAPHRAQAGADGPRQRVPRHRVRRLRRQADVRQLGPRMTIVVPGTRPADADVHDQARTTTPGEAIDAGADLLVIGRTVLAADDPAAAAEAIVESIVR